MGVCKSVCPLYRRILCKLFPSRRCIIHWSKSVSENIRRAEKRRIEEALRKKGRRAR